MLKIVVVDGMKELSDWLMEHKVVETCCNLAKSTIFIVLIVFGKKKLETFNL